jgi:hypothetical protein
MEAEARIADAENRIAEVLAETASAVETGDQERGRLLAEKLSLEDEVEKLRREVLTVESTILADWDSDRIQQSHLREKLNDIATEVSRIVYAVEGHGMPDSEESLFDRVQRYADDGLKMEEFPVAGRSEPKRLSANSNGNVSDRLAALRELQERN